MIKKRNKNGLYINLKVMQLMKENGFLPIEMVMEYRFGRMVQNTKVNGVIINHLVREPSTMLVVINISVNGKIIVQMALVYTNR